MAQVPLGSCHKGIAFDRNGKPAGGAQITVCSVPYVGGVFCGTPVQVFYDVALTTALPFPSFAADMLGNYEWCATGGTHYVEQVSAGGHTTSIDRDVMLAPTKEYVDQHSARGTANQIDSTGGIDPVISLAAGLVTFPGSVNFATSSLFTIPMAPGFVGSVNAQLSFDTAAQNYHGYQNSADALFAMYKTRPTNGQCATWITDGTAFVLGSVPCSSGGGGGGGTVLSVSGTTNQILSTGGANPVLSLDV